LGSTAYQTLAEAQTAGAPTLNYGNFIQTMLDFLIVAWAVFMMVKGINAMKKKEEQAPEEPAKPSEEVVLLQEIRDAIRK
jgi:large conductance mechanosensitive channel